MSLIPRSRLTCDSTRSPRTPVITSISPSGTPTQAGLPSRNVHRQHGRGDAEYHRAAKPLPRLLRADRGRHQVLAEQHPGHIAADIGEHDGDDHRERSDAAVVLEDQQRAEAREQRHPRREQHGGRNIAQIVHRLLAKALPDQPPDHAHHDRAAVRAQQACRAVRPRQPDHRLAADQQRNRGKGVAGLLQPAHDLERGDRNRHRQHDQPALWREQ